MPLYLFHLCRLDGASPSFEAHELETDARASIRAGEMLIEHPSCAYVAVWRGDTEIERLHRTAGVCASAADPAQDRR